MDFLVSAWLTQRSDVGVKPTYAKVEAILADLYDALNREQFAAALTIIQTHELDILAQHLPTTPRQETRFWFLTAQYHALMNAIRPTSEAYNLCNQTCPRHDDLAMLQIHHDWGHVAFRETNFLQALMSFSKAISIAEQPKWRKQPFLMYSDSEGLLSSLYLHRAFLAQQSGQLDRTKRDLQAVSQFIASWSHQASPLFSSQTTGRLLEIVKALQSAIANQSEVAQQTWDILLATLRPAYLPQAGQF